MYQIPITVLEQMPKFDPEVFKNVKMLYQHVKARTRLTEKNLEKVEMRLKSQSDEEDEFVIKPKPMKTTKQKSSEKRKSPEIETNEENCPVISLLSDVSITPRSDFKQRNFELDDQEPISLLSDLSDYQKDTPKKVEVQESPMGTKRGAFQLKKPVMAKLDSEVSRTIGELWEKNSKHSQEKSQSPPARKNPVDDSMDFGESDFIQNLDDSGASVDNRVDAKKENAKPGPLTNELSDLSWTLLQESFGNDEWDDWMGEN